VEGLALASSFYCQIVLCASLLHLAAAASAAAAAAAVLAVHCCGLAVILTTPG